MLDRRMVPILLLGLAIPLGTTVQASTSGKDLPDRFIVRGLDGEPVVTENPVDGRTWTAWPYRSGGEYDIALSFHDLTGFWSEPTFLGRFDGLDQIQPTLTVDPQGNTYLAHTTRPGRNISVMVLPAGATAWLSFAVVQSGSQASIPSLQVVGNDLVLAYLSGRRIHFAKFPLFVPAVQGNGIQDGPDGVDPLGTAL